MRKNNKRILIANALSKAGMVLAFGLSVCTLAFPMSVSAEEVQNVTEISEGILTLGEEKTIFLTDTGQTQYQKLEITKAQKYLLHASSLADSVSIVIANDKHEVVNILDQNTMASSDGVSVYTTTALADLDAGTWYIGVSSQRVAKIALKVSEPVKVTQDVTASQTVTPKDGMIAYSFTPSADGIYKFFQAASGGELSLKLYDEAGVVKKNLSDYQWLYDWGVTFEEFQAALEKGKTYYLTVSGTYDSKKATNYLTISSLLQKDCEKLVAGKEVTGSIESYNKNIFYKIKPEEAGTYFFHATSGDGYPNYSVYSEEELLMQKASITKYGYDSYDNRVYKTQLALSLKAGKTYYVVLRMEDYGKGDYSLKVKKLEKVKKITMLHKPSQKVFIKNLDSHVDLDGTVLSIQYKNGKTSKWVYNSSDRYKEGYKVLHQIKKVGNNKVVTFTYRDKKVTYKIPILKVNKAYTKVKELKENKALEGVIKNGKYRFFRFVPEETGLYGFEGVSNEYFRMALFGEKGGRKARANARYIYDSKTKRSYRRCRVAQPLIKGKTYYIGAYYAYSTDDSSVQIKVYADDPAAPKQLTIKQTDENQAKLSWKEVKKAFGYQIVYYPAGNTKDKKRLTTVYAAGNYVDVKKGTTYYFKVRAYRQVGNKKYYGDFSEVKTFRY